ncbi:ShlB/FhaC/HecB family hemolysin secretion/activation protein [Cyanobium sp. ATX 6F1]|uniref:ShlB/FhaC/HecB family hemolysin secretion/activation protein n=1 Tax=unclassified Cyanobium TaxID=2627006 RepID=UPI0020CD3802|nr:ShlB/FhaC/HecB family hemolysin secretion/activation protein [Cyanobium sp. ATX 6F1]MCP9915942.1 ShlB/FhaC/HecB family hemolysin secretion/activation protein [Cyanobium sp. ATX 6F1]
MTLFSKPITHVVGPIAVLSSALLVAPGWAQPSGRVERRIQDEQRRDQLRQVDQQQLQPQQPLIEGLPGTPAALPQDSVPSAAPPIKGVELEGSSLPTPGWLKPLQERYISQSATQEVLAKLRADLEAAYERAQLLVSVGEPLQRADGVVVAPVVEARLGAVRIPSNQAPISSNWAIATVLDAVGKGQPLRLDKLESALLKLGDLGGVQARAELQPGDIAGSTDVLLNLRATRQVQGELNLNNQSTIDTGPYQAQATLNLNGLAGRGEVLSLFTSYSGNVNWYGSRYAGTNVTLPLTPGGLNATGSVNWSDYRLLKDQAPFDYKGSFASGSVGLSQVLWRRPRQNLSWNVSAEVDHFTDEVLGYQYSNRTNWVGRFTLMGDNQDNLFGLGINSGLLTLSVGNLGLDGPFEAELDELGAAKAGAWGKLFGLYRRYQMFRDSRWSVELFSQAQVAFNNLDTVEKMSLGWPNGVRAYPPGEALGDSGLSGQLTLRYQLASNLIAKGFVDGGYIWRWTSSFADGELPGQLGLWGPGLGLEWGTHGDLLASLDVAWPLGNNLYSPTGNDVDGLNASVRVWVSLRKWF